MARPRVYYNNRKVSLEWVARHKWNYQVRLEKGDPYQRISANPKEAERVARMTVWEYIDWCPELSRG